MNKIIRKTLVISASLLLGLSGTIPLQAQMPTRNALVEISDGVYRGTNGTWHNLIYVTPGGILIADTITTAYSNWLKTELTERFPNLQVKYVVYSHSHWDHSEGGKAFADTATFIAQETMLENLDGRYPNMPGDMVDRNNNGLIDPEEIKIPWDDAPGICGFPPLDFKDTNGDGHLTSAEFFAEVQAPDIGYKDKMTLVLGGKTIELIYPGRNHANDMTVVHLKDEGILFAVDFLADALVRGTMRSLPSACGPFDGHSMDEWIESYHRVEEIDFDMLVTGHGAPSNFTKQDVVETREFFEYLKAEVSAAIESGLSLEEMQQSIMLEPYRDWDQYEALRASNIKAAYLNLLNIK